MSDASEQILERIERLNTYKRGNRRAPHKPLLILVALGRLFGGKKKIAFREVEAALLPLLNAFAPPRSGKHQPELPYWYLQSDELWEVEGAELISKQQGGFPRRAALRQTQGGFPEQVEKALLTEGGLAEEVIRRVLEEHFPPSLHEDLLVATGLDNVEESIPQVGPPQAKRVRDPRFRDHVLRAYEHRCAVTGFRAALGGSYFGCEAAHVQWHAYDGPDLVENGLSLEPTLHKLFDAGAWTLTDDRRVLVSAEYTGSDSAVERLRERHGQAVLSPIAGEPTVSLEYIRWHRDPKLGGVFREPALKL